MAGAGRTHRPAPRHPGGPADLGPDPVALPAGVGRARHRDLDGGCVLPDTVRVVEG
ncbi:MAG: hypothetical protein AVDCRST_MAG66-4325 [uncultured Pseudonocardia sp.]|uniref:Uncharacterized protein n=1 Tax=uncultured Pseudonocardia sp. TaxID=211455 RepID=A0A6J4QHN3_9PSEU|nr:MAG: hypothetical protein AVDCRST_MAG66-4325 [uncultured Pseudonocardia sp.]